MYSSTRTITIKDIAAEVGVSKSAVSLALNNKPGISAGLRQKIFETAALLGYQPPDVRLVQKIETPKSITAVFQYGSSGTDDDYSALHSMSVEWLKGMRAFLQEKQSNFTFFEGHGEISYLGQQILNDKNHPIDGLILMGPGVHRQSQLVQRALQQHIPTSIVCRSWPELPINTVGQSYRKQAALALEYLLNLGHKRIAFAARTYDQGYEWFEERLDEFKTMMRTRLGVPPQPFIFVDEDEAQLVKQIAAVSPSITAVFALHDSLAFRLLDCFEAHGFRVPDDFSIIGQDDTLPNDNRRLGLTTIGNDHFQVGYQAAEALFKQIRSKEIVCSKITLRSYLIERDSCRQL